MSLFRSTRTGYVRGMSLSDYQVGAAVAVTDMTAARDFYEGKLGLRPYSDSEPEDNRRYGCANGSLMHVFVSPHAGKAEATLAGWGVDDIEAVVDDLTARGVPFEHYGSGPIITDTKGIATFPGNNRVAYFRDPDGNILSIAQAGAP